MIDLNFTIEGGDFSRAGYASSQVKKTLKQLGFNQQIIKNIVVALYESEVNIVAHAHNGNIKVEILPHKVQMIVSDSGPGIADIQLAMKEGYSTASEKVRQMGFGAGMGLSNIKKNVDSLNIDTKVGQGTTLTMIKHNKNG
jgi:anti-sigma regulatory factor (Ser/Thr protein kinase)